MPPIAVVATMSALFLCACAITGPGALTPASENAELVQGPPVEVIVTPFDPALQCLKGRIGKDLAFSVGTIADNTGKEQYADNGSGKFVTQGAGDIVQSALFLAGVTVVNRRDPNIALAESNWGIRKLSDQFASDFYITGSINSLDFIPGGGGRIELAGVGPRYRQSRILIGIDLALTAAHSGEIVANSSVQKQIYTEEMGIAANRFFADVLVTLEVGGMEREALHLALRQILSYSTFDLLAQVANQTDVADCAAKIADGGTVFSDGNFSARSGDGLAFQEARAAASEAEIAASAPAAAPVVQADVVQPPTADTALVAPPAPLPLEAQQLANAATSYAAKAIASADSVLNAKTAAEATAAVDLALQFMTLAIQTLREAATKGLVGPEGDAVATLVEKAIMSTQGAQKIAADMAAKEAAAGVAIPVTPPVEPLAPPVSSDDKRLGGASN